MLALLQCSLIGSKNVIIMNTIRRKNKNQFGRIDVNSANNYPPYSLMEWKTNKQEFPAVNYEWIKSNNQIGISVFSIPFVFNYPYYNFIVDNHKILRDDEELIFSTTHFKIIRPLGNLTEFIEYTFENGITENENLFRLVYSLFKFLHRLKMLDSNKVDEIFDKFEVCEKILSRALRTDFKHESEVAHNMFNKRIKEIFYLVLDKEKVYKKFKIKKGYY